MKRLYLKSTIKLFACFLFSSVSGLASVDAATDIETWRIVKGQSRVESVPGVRQVAIGDARIAGVKVVSQGREIMLTGLKPGMTTLTIWREQKKINRLVRVLARDPRLVADDLKQIVAGIPGIVVRTVGERVLISGRVLSATDFRKIEMLAKLYPEVLNFVEPNHVDFDQLVRVNVSLVEISKSSGSEAGFSWPDSLGLSADGTMNGNLGPGIGPLDGTIVLSTQLAASLKLLNSNGAARALANPTLVTKNGEEATFHAGGQIPVPVVTGLGQSSVQWHDYGVELKVLPHVDRTGNFHLELEIAVSDLDSGNAVETDAGTLPAIRRRSTSSHVNLASGESLVLAELVDRREGKVVGRVPGLGHLPILGELFRTRKTSKQDTEVYVILTPTLLRPGSLPSSEPTQKKRRYRDSESVVRPSVLEKQ